MRRSSPALANALEWRGPMTRQRPSMRSCVATSRDEPNLRKRVTACAHPDFAPKTCALPRRDRLRRVRLENIDGGTLELDGRDITRLASSKRDLAMVFQSYALYPHMSVAENMSFA